MFREHSQLLQKNDKKLFRKTFRENSRHTSKSKMHTLEMLSNTSRTKYKVFATDLPGTEKEFRRGATTKAASQEKNNVTVFEKTRQ